MTSGAELYGYCDEKWRHIEGYEGKYSVSTWGRVAMYDRLNRRIPLKPLVKTGGYHYVGLWRKRKRQMFRVHRLVAIAFIPNPENLPEVNHIDGVNYYNFVWNLEWVNRSDNMRNVYARLQQGEQ